MREWPRAGKPDGRRRPKQADRSYRLNRLSWQPHFRAISPGLIARKWVNRLTTQAPACIIACAVAPAKEMLGRKIVSPTSPVTGVEKEYAG